MVSKTAFVKAGAVFFICHIQNFIYNKAMKIIIKASQIEITPSLKSYIESKIGSVEKFIKRFEDKEEAEALIEIARSTKHHRHGDVFYAEANFLIKGKKIRAEKFDEDIRAAVDGLRDTLKTELQKYKEKKELKIRREEKTGKDKKYAETS